VSPRPQADMKIICAGQSDAGLEFSAQYADYNFVFGKGLNTPTAYAEINDRLKEKTDVTGRDVQTYVLFMVIAAETDEEAQAKWQHYNDGADMEAINWLMNQGGKDTTSGADTNIRQMASSVSPVNINMGTLVGSYENVARMLDEIGEIKGTEGVLLTFDDFIQGVEDFGQKIQPLMKCRDHIVIEDAAPVLEKSA
jgi:Coenzyme F420-dependent N5,N10-methylene tetrahydromethanopterin reductase and related flavin-dependent oxidoreductases